MTELSAALDFARDAALVGGKIALDHFGRDPASQRKADGSWVTEADWAVEAQIRLRIARSFPDHNIFGEEEGLTGAGGGAPTEGAPTWVLDPIDGTHNYMRGVPIWATLVALQVDGRNIVGVCHAPALSETYFAADGLGAWMNDRPIRVDDEADLAAATLVLGDPTSYAPAGLHRAVEELGRRSWRTRGFGDFWGHMLVARGAAHVMIEPHLAPWDVAALEPIVAEAGGRLTHATGAPWSGAGSCLTTSGRLHDEVISIIAANADPAAS